MTHISLSARGTFWFEKQARRDTKVAEVVTTSSGANRDWQIIADRTLQFVSKFLRVERHVVSVPFPVSSGYFSIFLGNLLRLLSFFVFR
jgi:hypothetical protein